MRDRNIKRESNPAVLFIDEEHKVMSFHAWSVKRIYTGVQILSFLRKRRTICTQHTDTYLRKIHAFFIQIFGFWHSHLIDSWCEVTPFLAGLGTNLKNTGKNIR
jgi:hypothetical protein